jgi:hypothetical protein
MAMDSEQPSRRITASEWLLLALIVSLPFVKPAISYPILLTDLIFILLLVAVAAEILLGRRADTVETGLLDPAALCRQLCAVAACDAGPSAQHGQACQRILPRRPGRRHGADRR